MQLNDVYAVLSMKNRPVNIVMFTAIGRDTVKKYVK